MYKYLEVSNKTMFQLSCRSISFLQAYMYVLSKVTQVEPHNKVITTEKSVTPVNDTHPV